MDGTPFLTNSGVFTMNAAGFYEPVVLEISARCSSVDIDKNCQKADISVSGSQSTGLKRRKSPSLAVSVKSCR